MSTIKLTAKRQATLPVEFCREMGVKPGDEINVEKRLVDGERVWLIRPQSRSYPWFGSLKKYAKNVKSHDMADLRKSIGEGIVKENKWLRNT